MTLPMGTLSGKTNLHWNVSHCPQRVHGQPDQLKVIQTAETTLFFFHHCLLIFWVVSFSFRFFQDGLCFVHPKSIIIEIVDNVEILNSKWSLILMNADIILDTKFYHKWRHNTYRMAASVVLTISQEKQKQLENASGEMESKWSNDLIFKVHTCSTELWSYAK